MTQLLATLFNIFIVLFFFGFTIFVHELGHFLVARRLGFKILEFSIGFGPALWKKTVGGIVYKWGVLPLGGYVKLPQMDPTGASLTEEEKRQPVPVMEPWKRIAVGLAGVVCNMILAFVLALIVMWVGRPADDRDYGTTVDYLSTNSVLYTQGLRPGDVIERINGHPVENWEQVITEGALNPDVVVEARRGTEIVEVRFATNSVQAAASVFAMDAGPSQPAIIGLMYTNWPAYRAGLRTGDHVLTIDGVPVIGRGHMISIVSSSGGRPLRVEFARGDGRQSITVTPVYDEQLEAFRIGHQFDQAIVHPHPLDEIRYAGGAVFRLLDRLTTRTSAGRAFDAMGGVPEIFFAFWVMAKASLIRVISFAVTINVNLAILNLLPIPVLDGGHILLAICEWIRRRQVSVKFVSALWQACAVCLVSLMLFLTARGMYRVTNWISLSREEAGTPATNAVKSMLRESPVHAPP